MNKTTILSLCALVALISLAYANHFQNTFHFDDSHAVVDNPYIRDLHNIPRIFVDVDTSTTLPANRGWRPIVTASLALDYWLGGGLKPFWFQASTFFWFLVQVLLMYGLFLKICDRALPDSRNQLVALFAAALYGVHPAMAETVNYVVQRADVYSTLGVVAGIFLYAFLPRWRRYGVYLIPVILGVLSKAPTLIFPAILFCWIWLAEDEKPVVALRRSVPALILTVTGAILSSAMTSKAFNPGASSASAYRLTQPIMALHYFSSFFLPIHLSADSDSKPVAGLFDGYAWAGFLFLIALIGLTVFCTRRRELRPIAFGLFWFILALAPTAVFPLAEVENDHRMFFPFVGLSLSVCWAAALWLYAHPLRREVVVAVCGLVLMVAVWGTVERNQVWHTEESLWRDVSEKSPQNGRGLMNYGLALMARGDYPDALSYFQRALVLNPNYSTLEVNLGVVNGAMNRDAEAERHFARAQQLAPGEAVPDYFYAVWLKGKGRWNEAAEHLNAVVRNDPAYLDADYRLMEIYADQRDAGNLRKAALAALAIVPSDKTAQTWLARADNLKGAPASAAMAAGATPATPEDWLNRSLALYQQGKFEESIAAAQNALKARPNYAPAWNNIAASYGGMGKWDDSIHAAQEAVRIDPDFQLAKSNLAWAEKQKHSSLP